MKPVDMIKLCEYLLIFDDHRYGAPEITTSFNDIFVDDYHNLLDAGIMDELGCDWEPWNAGFKVRGV